MTDIHRRDLLKIAGATALTPRPARACWIGCGTGAGDGLGVLRGFTFTGQKGEPVNIDALARSLKGKPFTVSFAFVGCSTLHAPMYQALSGLEKVAPDLVHVVIDTVPEFDNSSPDMRQSLMDELQQKDKNDKGMKNEIYILYPSSDDLGSIQEKLGFVASPNPRGIVQIALYGRDGKQIGIKSTEENTPEDIIGAWRDTLSASRGL